VFRLLMLSGVMAFILAGVAWVKPDFLLGGGASTTRLLYPNASRGQERTPLPVG
jgi:hypothetical protein